MEHSLLVGFHGNRFVCCSPWQPLLRAWRQPSMVRLSIVRHRIWGLGYCRGALTSLTMSGKLMMVADEWRTNGCIKPCCEEIKKAQQPSSTLQSTGHFGVLQTMENFDDLPWNFSLRWPAWRCLDFATVLAKLGIDQLLTYASSAGGLGASLCSLPLSSTPSSTPNYKPMLAHSRTTTEQRSCMDALELGNDSGSLLACRNRELSSQARGGLRGWTRRLGLDQQRLEAPWTRRRTRIEGGQGVRFRRASLTCLPILLTGGKTLHGRSSLRKRTAHSTPSRQHSTTRPSTGLKFRSGSFHGLSQQTEAQQLNILSMLFDSNDRGSCGDALGPAVASFSASRVVLVVLVVVKSSHRLVVFHRT